MSTNQAEDRWMVTVTVELPYYVIDDGDTAEKAKARMESAVRSALAVAGLSTAHVSSTVREADRW